MPFKLTPKSEKYIIENWETKTDEEMAKKLKCKASRVAVIRRERGLIRRQRRYDPEVYMPYVRDHYKTESVDEMIQNGNLTQYQVQRALKAMGLYMVDSTRMKCETCAKACNDLLCGFVAKCCGNRYLSAQAQAEEIRRDAPAGCRFSEKKGNIIYCPNYVKG